MSHVIVIIYTIHNASPTCTSIVRIKMAITLDLGLKILIIDLGERKEMKIII